MGQIQVKKRTVHQVCPSSVSLDLTLLKGRLFFQWSSLVGPISIFLGNDRLQSGSVMMATAVPKHFLFLNQGLIHQWRNLNLKEPIESED